MNYKLAYAIGFHPWEDAAGDPPFADKFSEVIAREENGREAPDTGTFHGLNSAQREAAGREVSAVAAPDATVLLLIWPRRRRPLIPGVTHSEVQAAFPGWKVTNVEPSHFSLPKPMELVLRPDEHWYRLRRE